MKKETKIVEKRILGFNYLYVKVPYRVYGFTWDYGCLTLDLGKRQISISR